MKHKICFSLFNYIMLLVFSACNGPRYIHSSSPLISPVKDDKAATNIDAAYFSHNKGSNNYDTSLNKDNAVGFDISHMKTERIKLLAHLDFKKEKNLFPFLTDSLAIRTFNGGFDSSVVNTKRFTAGFGMVYFFNSPDSRERFVPSIAGAVYLHHMKLQESGILKSSGMSLFGIRFPQNMIHHDQM